MKNIAILLSFLLAGCGERVVCNGLKHGDGVRLSTGEIGRFRPRFGQAMFYNADVGTIAVSCSALEKL